MFEFCLLVGIVILAIVLFRFTLSNWYVSRVLALLFSIATIVGFVYGTVNCIKEYGSFTAEPLQIVAFSSIPLALAFMYLMGTYFLEEPEFEGWDEEYSYNEWTGKVKKSYKARFGAGFFGKLFGGIVLAVLVSAITFGIGACIAAIVFIILAIRGLREGE